MIFLTTKKEKKVNGEKNASFFKEYVEKIFLFNTLFHLHFSIQFTKIINHICTKQVGFINVCQNIKKLFNINYYKELLLVVFIILEFRMQFSSADVMRKF